MSPARDPDLDRLFPGDMHDEKFQSVVKDKSYFHPNRKVQDG